MIFLHLLLIVGLVYTVKGYDQCEIVPIPAPTLKPMNIQTVNRGTPILPHASRSNLGRFIPKYIMQPLNIKMNIDTSYIEFHIPTESEIRTKHVMAELDTWFHETFPVLFPTYIDCQRLTWEDCVWQEGCSWCKWPTENCQYTDVSYILPTPERCIDGGIPFHPEQLPTRLCGGSWFEEC